MAEALTTEITRSDSDIRSELRGHVSLNRLADKCRKGLVSEVMTTSDFAYMADLIDRGVMQGNLNESLPLVYETIGWRRDNRDFRAARDYEINAARTIPRVEEKGEYKPLDPEISDYEFQVYKYGCQWDVSWEAWLSDGRDLRLIADYPPSLGLSARYTRAEEFTRAYAVGNPLLVAGRNWFNVANPFASGNTALTPANLAQAITLMRSFPDASGNVRVYAGPLYLVVPPAQAILARQMAASNSASLEWAGFGNQGATSVQMTGPPQVTIAGVVEDPFLPAVDPVNGNTAWYLFADPNFVPAIRYGYLVGYEQPEIWVRDSDARALMGGSEDPFAGSWATDDIEFKLRFTFGVGYAKWQGILGATGEGDEEELQ